jgi:hypothetical protein
MLRFIAATVAILIRCRIIVIQRLRARMIAFQTPTVRLKAIIEGLEAVAVVFVIYSSSCCRSVGAVIHGMMTVRVGTHITVCGCLIVTSAAHIWLMARLDGVEMNE